MKKFLILFLVSGLVLFTMEPVLAARKRVRSTGGIVSTTGVTSSVKFRGDRRAILIYLNNLNRATSVTYSLSYTGNGIAQGAQGTIVQAENTTTRELLFGTCSKNVCTYHQNITNARLEIRSKLKDGRTTLKSYRLKV